MYLLLMIMLLQIHLKNPCHFRKLNFKNDEMKDKKEGNSICKWFKKKEPLSEKTNFDAAGKLDISTTRVSTILPLGLC